MQVAGGADTTALRASSIAQDEAPKLLGNKTAWTTPLRRPTACSLPLQEYAEAQTFVNDLKKRIFPGQLTSAVGRDPEAPAK